MPAEVAVRSVLWHQKIMLDVGGVGSCCYRRCRRLRVRSRSLSEGSTVLFYTGSGPRSTDMSQQISINEAFELIHIQTAADTDQHKCIERSRAYTIRGTYTVLLIFLCFPSWWPRPNPCRNPIRILDDLATLGSALRRSHSAEALTVNAKVNRASEHLRALFQLIHKH